MTSNKKVFLAILLMVLGWSNNCFCQTFAFQQFTIEDGLPGSTVYSMVQDKNKVIWAATDAGLCKFDGYAFETLEDENIKGEIVRLLVDSKGKIWMIDLAEKLSYWEDGRLFNFHNNLEDFPIYTLHEDPNQNFWFLHRDKVSVIIENEDPQKMPQHIKYEEKGLVSLKTILSVDKNHTIILSKFGVFHFKDYEMEFQPFIGDVPTGDFPKGGVKMQDSILLVARDRIYSLSPSTNLIRPSLSEYDYLFDAGVTNLFNDEDDGLWISTRSGVLYFQKQADGSTKMRHLLKGVVINSIFQDHEKNIWISTQQEGVFKLSSTQVNVYKNEELGDKIAIVNSFSKDEIILGYHNNWMAVLDKNLQLLFKEKLSKRGEEIYDADYDEKNDELYIVANFGIFKMEKNPYKISEVFDGSGYKTLAIGKNNESWIGNFSSTSKKNLLTKKGTTILQKRTYSICLSQEEDVWIGTVDGIFNCKNVPCTKVDIPELEKDIRDLIISDDNTLWIATQANGVFLYKDGKVIRRYNIKNGLSSDNCHKILLKDNFAWIATNNGVSKINLENNFIEVIRKDEGLPSNDVKNLHLENDKIYVGTSKGLAVLEENFTVDRSTPHLFISKIKIENQDTTIQEFYELPHHKNDIRINFMGVTFRNAKDVIYQYKMVGIDQDWNTSKFKEVTYPSLGHGVYEFLVKAKSLNSDWTEVKKITFEIQKAWWQTYWFYSIVAVCFFLIGAKLLQRVIGSINKRNEIEQNLKESQLVALRSQMDPHFIFNALNSIQDFIVQEDKRSANHYLSQFSKLMRNILNVSDKNEISLKKEIDYLKLYLSLEALRFEDQFHYEFEIDENLNIENIFIPSMLIQPFIENAIKHGLMHKSGKKNLWVRFFKKENYLLCEVEDDGIGREKSKMINAQNPKIFKSKGMGLTKERIDLLNHAKSDTLGLIIEDLMNDDGTPRGTKVMIRIF